MKKTMKKKGMVKFQGSESKGLLNYVEYNGEFVSITRSSSRKIKDIKKNKKLKVTFGMFSRDFKEVPVSIVDDEVRVKKVFEHMKTAKHTHYKEFVEDLVILKYTL